MRAISTSPSHVLSVPPSHVLSWAGLAGILTIATARCVIAFAPQISFDTDPAFDEAPLLAMGSAGSMTLDALLLLACAIALAGEWLCGRGVNWIVMLLSLIPAPIVFFHGWRDAGDMWLGSTMLAAAAACATIAHLARDRLLRATIIAVLLGATIPVMARGIVQVTHEHPQTVQYYQEHKQQFLHDRGWAPDSSAARIYERRLKQPQPTAWFSTSNVVASLSTCAFVMCAGLAIAGVRARMQSGWSGTMVLCAIPAAAMVWLSGSKGAALAATAGTALLIFGQMMAHSQTGTRRFSRAAIAFIALAIVGVIVRGALLAEDFAGDRSLLFRWHYWIAATRIFLENPLMGAGPDGFQAAYMVHRVPRNPEEVTSAHSIFIDWLTMLGVFGVFWIALVIALLWGGREAPLSGESNFTPAANQHFRALEKARMSPAPSRARASILMPLVVLALGIIPAHALEWPAMDGVGLLGRLLGAAGFMCIAVVAVRVAWTSTPSLVHHALLCAVAALLIHGQIDMTFVQPGAAVWAMCAVGAIGLPETPGRAPRSPLALASIALIVITISMVTFAGIIPALQQQREMRQAARMLRPIAHDKDNVELALRLRRAAAGALVNAYETWPANVHALNAAALQLQLACAQPGGPRPIGLLLDANQIIDRALEQHDKASSVVIAIDVNAQLAALTGDAEHWNRAIELARELARRDPHGIAPWRRLGDVLWAAGERDAAADAYRRALQNDSNFELDELKQLTSQQRELIERRIKESQSP